MFNVIHPGKIDFINPNIGKTNPLCFHINLYKAIIFFCAGLNYICIIDDRSNCLNKV